MDKKLFHNVLVFPTKLELNLVVVSTRADPLVGFFSRRFGKGVVAETRVFPPHRSRPNAFVAIT